MPYLLHIRHIITLPTIIYTSLKTTVQFAVFPWRLNILANSNTVGVAGMLPFVPVETWNHGRMKKNELIQRQILMWRSSEALTLGALYFFVTPRKTCVSRTSIKNQYNGENDILVIRVKWTAELHHLFIPETIKAYIPLISSCDMILRHCMT